MPESSWQSRACYGKEQKEARDYMILYVRNISRNSFFRKPMPTHDWLTNPTKISSSEGSINSKRLRANPCSAMKCGRTFGPEVRRQCQLPGSVQTPGQQGQVRQVLMLRQSKARAELLGTISGSIQRPQIEVRAIFQFQIDKVRRMDVASPECAALPMRPY